LGSSQITIPDGVTVLCGRNAVLERTADVLPILPMVSVGNFCKWTGGTLTKGNVSGTSVTSQTIGTGVKTFATQAGVAIFAVGQFLRFQSRGATASHMEGTVTAYSGTSITVDFAFATGSGAHTDWDISSGSGSNSSMELAGVTQSVIENVRVTGAWYVGLLMSAFNPVSVTLVTSSCTFRNCWVEGAQNRGIYLYGTCNYNLVENCYVDGQSALGDYGVNLNPGNPSGTVNTQTGNKVVNTNVVGCGFQGFEIGDLCTYNRISSCYASNITAASGVGFLVQTANSNTPTYNRINDCHAIGCSGEGFAFIAADFGGADDCTAFFCGIGFYIAASGATQSVSVALNGCEAESSTTVGFQVAGNSSRCDLNGIKAISNGTNGVQIDAGAVRTLVTGRSFGNSGSNLSDAGTVSVTTGLTTA